VLGGQVQHFSVASQFVTMVMGVFARWSSGGNQQLGTRKKRGTKLIPGGACTIAFKPSVRPV
jgi:hypothetical protein